MKRAVLVPTYNEAENIANLIAAIREADPVIDIIVVDDASPDGTGRIAEELGVRVIHRAGKQGLGAAYIHGFAVALTDGYEALAQMDADFSHPPAVLPVMFQRLAEDADVCIGSRYVKGGGTENWGYHRQLLSGTANRIARNFLGLAGNDVTSGFRAYRREVLEAIDLPSVKSQGYAFQVELQYRCERRGYRVAEVPIVFVDRAAGTSKMSLKEIRGGVANLLRLRFSAAGRPSQVPPKS